MVFSHFKWDHKTDDSILIEYQKNVFNRRNNSWKSWPDKGIVAGLIDEIGIVELINQKLGVDNREKITTGQVIKALILNGLGMVSRPLYLFSQFFEDKLISNLKWITRVPMTLKKTKEIIEPYLEKVKFSPETDPEIQEITREFQKKRI